MNHLFYSMLAKLFQRQSYRTVCMFAVSISGCQVVSSETFWSEREGTRATFS